jgi:signal transduction histidine kinase
MNHGVTKWLARAMVAVAAIVAVSDIVLLVVARHQLSGPSDLLSNGLGIVAAVLYPALGLLIAVRARNVIGWILSVVGVLVAINSLSALYPAVALLAHPGSLPGPKVVSSVLQPSFVAAYMGLGLVLLLFPNGKPPSSRWGPVIWIGLAGTALSYVGLVLKPGPLDPVADLRFFNPLGVHSSIISNALVVAAWAMTLAIGASFVALVVRFRRGTAELRQQVKWLGLVAAAAGACILSALVSLVICGCDNSPIGNVLFPVFFLLVVFGIPAALAIAVFKYRLYDVDLIISKAVLFALLAAFFTGVYVAIVIGIGAAVGSRGSSFLTVAAAVVIAVAFQPVRERARRLANRIVYGKRSTPYEVLSEFSDRVAGTYSSEDVLPRMAQVLGTGTGATTARVWLRLEDELKVAASWPENGAMAPVAVTGDRPGGFPPGEFGVEVRHQGELLGALSAVMPASDPMNPQKAKLVGDLAAQAGLVLKNVRLIEDLRSSRRRIVTAQDERAKALERNIHDGAQQQLVALSVKQRLVQMLIQKDPQKAEQMLAEIQTDTVDALENLRDLARGIYPPLLADQGLAAALTAQARKAALPVEVEADGAFRSSPEIESAAYFCCLEALQNVAKYAGAGQVTVRLSADDSALTFEVIDDGRGFDRSATSFGTGLRGMADRLEALGGTLQVESEPGRGTTVTGRIPYGSRPPQSGTTT